MRVNDRHRSFYYELDNDMGEVHIVPEKTALLIIDMQNVFVKRPIIQQPTEIDEKRAAMWEPFYQIIDTVTIPNNIRILKAFREKGIEVAYAMIESQKRSGSDRSLVQKATGFNELLLPKGSEASRIIPELAPLEDEIVVKKTTDSAITGTTLRLTLRNMGIDSVVVTGVFLDQCVSGTVRALADESFHVWLIEDATRAATDEIQKNELEILNNIYCHVINTNELMQAIES